jgi:7,8-dihydro-6-hydroxymethylpterin-pyrophosphokinase
MGLASVNSSARESCFCIGHKLSDAIMKLENTKSVKNLKFMPKVAEVDFLFSKKKFKKDVLETPKNESVSQDQVLERLAEILVEGYLAQKGYEFK